MTVEIVIPFRSRGTDPVRAENLQRVLQHWVNWPVVVVSDGRTGDEQFNRSAAYNRAVAQSVADVFVFTESDMLVPYRQVIDGVRLALECRGLVVGFTQYRYMKPIDSVLVRGGIIDPAHAKTDHVIVDGLSIGAVNVISRDTYDAVGGFDESFEGAWYDDIAMQRAFEITCGPTRWVTGPAYHLFHLPSAEFRGADTSHLSDADRAATARNERRYDAYMNATTPEQIRALTCGTE